MHNVGPPSKNSTTAWLSLSLCHHLTLIKTSASSFRLRNPFYYFLVSAILFWLDLVVPLKAMLFELESLERASRVGKEQIESTPSKRVCSDYIIWFCNNIEASKSLSRFR